MKSFLLGFQIDERIKIFHLLADFHPVKKLWVQVYDHSQFRIKIEFPNTITIQINLQIKAGQNIIFVQKNLIGGVFHVS